MAKYTKRRDKRGYEWKSAYREKEALMLERGYPEVSPHDFYRELFPAGSLQQEPEDGKGNIIATQIRPSGKGRTRQWVIDDSLKMLDKVVGDRFGLIPPISFYGKSHIPALNQMVPASLHNCYLFHSGRFPHVFHHEAGLSFLPHFLPPGKSL